MGIPAAVEGWCGGAEGATGDGGSMTAADGIRVVDVDAQTTDTFLEYARTFGPVHDDSYVSAEDLASFNAASEPALLALDASGVPLGAVSLLLDGFATEHLARFRILHASDPAAYPLLLDAILPRVPEGIERVYLFLPEHAADVVESLAAAGFAQCRRAYIMLNASPASVAELDLPGETTLELALPTASKDWANIINTAFHGHPGHFNMTAEEAAGVLGSSRVIRSGTLMAYRGGRPAGIVLTMADEQSPYSATVETLAVKPADQHIGMGRALLRAALRAAGRDGRSSVSLSVSTFNKRAMAMYLDAGFNVHDVRVCWEKRLA